MEEKRNLNWQGGRNEYYWSQSKLQSGYIAAGCGVLMIGLGLAVAALTALGVIS